MNLLELAQQVKEDAGISGSLTSAEGQSGEFLRVVNWVKRAVREIEGKWFDWDFLHEFYTLSTALSTSDYPPPSDLNLWDVTTAVRANESAPLQYEMWTRRKKDPTALQSGDPYMFTVLPNKSIRLYDTPTTVEPITIQYWRKPTVLVQNGDEPSIPEQFHEIIVAKALQYYANYESADEVKTQAIEKYNELITQLESHSAPSRQAHGNKNTDMDIQVIAEGMYEDY